MILTDTGPLVALTKTTDRYHAACRNAMTMLTPPLVTTWPAFTEALQILSRSGGYVFERKLWDFVHNGVLTFFDLDAEAIEHTSRLMEKCADTPMALADATLVAAAEQLDQDRIFTLDSDFTVYRRKNRKPFTLLP